MLLAATTTEKGEPYDDLGELYGRMLGQWTLELNHVASIVGGFDSQQKHVGQDGVRFTPIAKARQMEAVKFLNENAFATPAWALDKDVLRRIEPMGALNRVRNAQNSVLNNLLSGARFARLVEQQAVDGDNAYQPADFLADVRKGVWKELDAPRSKTDAYRRNLQRAYLDLVNNKLNGAQQTLPAGFPAAFAGLFATSGDERPFYRAELRALNTSVGAALAGTADRATRVHLEGVRDRIAKILDPKFAATGGPAPTTFTIFGFDDLDSFLRNLEICWPDYVIRP
jgi:hypothetical protein